MKKNQESNNFGNIMLVLGIVAVTMSLAGLTITFLKTNQLKEQMTGNAVGYVNLSIVQEINIASNGSIEWGEGLVNTTGGHNYSILETSSGAVGNVTGGNWSAGSKTQAIVITNVGNINISVTLSSRWLTGSAQQFFGGNVLYQNYSWKLSEKEPGSCVNPTNRFGTWNDANNSLNLCRNMGFIDGKDELYFNIRLWVPYDANVTGNKEARQDIITITGSPYA